MTKTWALGAGLATLFMAGAAMATSTYTIDSVSLLDGDYVTLTGGVLGSATDTGVLAGAYVISGTDQNGNSVFTVAFCDDLFRTLGTGLGYSVNPSTPYTYTPEPLSTAPLSTGGDTLSSTQVSDISGLVEEGLAMVEATPEPLDISDAIPALQAAIWYDEYGVTATFSDSEETTLYDGYIAQTFSTPPAEALTDGSDDGVDNDLQGLVTVPEPAAWSLMLIGFGAVGAFVRQRRSLAGSQPA